MLSHCAYGLNGTRLRVGLLWLALWVQPLSAMLAAQPADTAPTLKDVFSRPSGAETVARIPAVVTYVDSTWKLLFAQDDTAGCGIHQVDPRWDFSVGDRIVIEDSRLMLAATNPVHLLRAARVRRIQDGQLPKAVATSASNLFDHAFAALRVEVKGTVRSVVELSRLRLILRVEDQSFGVWIRHYEPSDLIGLLDAEVRLEAVCYQQDLGADPRRMWTDLLADDFDQIQIERLGSDRPYDLPLTGINQVPTLAGEPESLGRRLIRGRVVDQKQGRSLSLRDQTGEVLVLSSLQITLAKDDLVEAIGFPAYENGVPVLRFGQFRVVKSAAPSSPQAIAAQANPQLSVLTSLKQVLELSREQARQEYPLHVKGVITHWSPEQRLLFVQDGDYGVYVGLMSQPLEAKVGQLVEISGVTKAGGVLTMVSPARITVLGDGIMPPAPVMSYQVGMAGAYDSRRVRVQGVIQSTHWQDNALNMDLVATDGRFWCVVPAPQDSALRTNLLNVYVEAEGVCILNLDRVGCPLNVELRIQQESDIRVLQNAPTDAFSVSAMSISDALGFLPPAQGSRRVKLRGVATLWRPGIELFFQDSGGAIRAQSDQTNLVEFGDEVEVVGFRMVGENGVILKNAEYRVVGGKQVPVATRLHASEVLNLVNRDRLLEVEARLQQDVRPSAAPELVLQDGQEIFTARLEPLENGRLSPAWRAHSLLRVTGVCQLRLDELREPRAFRLLIRSPEDIQVLRAPPWFSTKRIVAISLLLLAVVIAAFGWIAALRARVAKQTEQIRQRLESEAAAERRLALVWEASADGMRMTDPNGVVVQVNQAYCEMTKKSREELEGKPYLEAFLNDNEESHLAEYRDRFRCHLVTPRQETKLRLWNGQEVWFDVADRFIEHTASSPLLLSQFRDVSERKLDEEEKNRLKEELLQAQKTESIGRLAGGVAHDFNNMLQVILGNTMLALEEAPEGTPLHDALKEIQRSAERSADLTRQLLGFARKQTVSPKVLDLNQTVASLLNMLQRLIGEHIDLRWIPGGDLWAVKIDPAQIHQILVNLCVNARDAIKESGEITIRTARVHTDETFAHAHPDCGEGDYTVLTVTDTGHGIDAETRKLIFEPFFTTKEIGKGTGLGLATVFGIVKQNRGAIDVDSEPNKGATFRIYLPRTDALAGPSATGESKAPMRGTETILLVEDEAQILQLGSRALTQYGYHVLTASCPEAALELVQRNPEPIDLLITDIVMPGMNGKELKRRIAAIRPGIRYIFMSGYNSEVIADHGVLEQGIDYLQKPFTVESFRQKVREVLQRSR
jgi:PAS domain S-box-containing protein